MISATLPKGSLGPYQVQAAIAAVHDEAIQSEHTDWPQILALYSILQQMSDNPMVKLNHAVAAAMVHSPATGLDLLATLDDCLKGIIDWIRFAGTSKRWLEIVREQSPATLLLHPEPRVFPNGIACYSR